MKLYLLSTCWRSKSELSWIGIQCWSWVVVECVGDYIRNALIAAACFICSISLELLREDCGFVAVWELWFSREALFMVSSSMSRLAWCFARECTEIQSRTPHHHHCLVHYRSLVWCRRRSWNEWAESDPGCFKNFRQIFQISFSNSLSVTKFSPGLVSMESRYHWHKQGLNIVKHIISIQNLLSNTVLNMHSVIIGIKLASNASSMKKNRLKGTIWPTQKQPPTFMYSLEDLSSVVNLRFSSKLSLRRPSLKN